jgi:ribose transport system substrate-binding protein
MAGKAVEVGFGILQGRPAPEGRVLVPVSLITRDNIAGYRGWTNK